MLSIINFKNAILAMLFFLLSIFGLTVGILISQEEPTTSNPKPGTYITINFSNKNINKTIQYNFAIPSVIKNLKSNQQKEGILYFWLKATKIVEFKDYGALGELLVGVEMNGIWYKNNSQYFWEIASTTNHKQCSPRAPYLCTKGVLDLTIKESKNIYSINYVVIT